VISLFQPKGQQSARYSLVFIIVDIVAHFDIIAREKYFRWKGPATIGKRVSLHHRILAPGNFPPFYTEALPAEVKSIVLRPRNNQGMTKILRKERKWK
jgi:hypothetical protein